VVVRGLRASAHGRQGRPDCDALGGCDLRGDERTRTADPLLAKQVLYQLSYVPLFACGDSESRPCTRLRQWITSQHLNDRAEMRDADMSVSTTQSVGDVRPRFISA
jgi:hypothetical protein